MTVETTNEQTITAYDYLLDLLCDVKDKQQLSQLLDALLTEKEQHELSNRIQIFAMLQDGRPQREISEKLGVGIATVSRGSKAYRKLEVEKLLPTLAKDLMFH